MMALATFMLSFAGFTLLALAMPKHHRDLFDEALEPGRKRALQLAGYALLGVSLVPSGAGYGISIGMVFWFGIVTVSALAVTLTLTYRPGLFAPGLVTRSKPAKSHE